MVLSSRPAPVKLLCWLICHYWWGDNSHLSIVPCRMFQVNLKGYYDISKSKQDISSTFPVSVWTSEEISLQSLSVTTAAVPCSELPSTKCSRCTAPWTSSTRCSTTRIMVSSTRCSKVRNSPVMSHFLTSNWNVGARLVTNEVSHSFQWYGPICLFRFVPMYSTFLVSNWRSKQLDGDILPGP